MTHQTLLDRITEQRERVTLAEQAWSRCKPEYEAMRWTQYQCEKHILDELYRSAKVTEVEV